MENLPALPFSVESIGQALAAGAATSNLVLVAAGVLMLAVVLLRVLYTAASSSKELTPQQKRALTFMPMAIAIMAAVAHGLATGVPSATLIANAINASVVALSSMGLWNLVETGRPATPPKDGPNG